MSLRRAGGSALRLLNVYASRTLHHGEQLKPLQAAAVHLTASSQHTLSRQNAIGAQSFWWQSHSCYHDSFKHFSTHSDKHEETPRPLPGAQDCDDAMEHYARARSLYQGNLAPPSSYKTATQRVIDVFVTAIKGTIAVLSWVVSLPAKLYSLSKWSRDDWSRWWAGAKKTLKDEAHHYWVGFKLLAFDVRVASGLAFKAMRGSQLTRRERKQLTRTTADMFRLVPMVIILVIPFMELALPILLKLFPNMLPSTFEDKLKKEEEVKKRLLVKMEVAKFLQDTVAEMAKNIKSKRTGNISTSAAELYSFVNRVRAGSPVSNDELVKFASLFNDELTLDNLDRVQLVSMCQLLSIPPFGTDGYLRNRLRSHLDGLKQDDLLIKQEGLDQLTDDELRSACKVRGMKAAFGPGATAHMRRQMQNWLDLSLNRGLPSSLLLLSRAFTITSPMPGAAGAAGSADQLGQLKETLLTLPEEVIKDVGLEVTAATTSAEELEKRLQVMQKEQKLIQAEAEAAELEAAASTPATMAGAHAGSAAAAANKDMVLEAEVQPPAAGDVAAQHAAAVAAATAVLNEASASALADVIAAEGISEEQRAVKIAEERQKRMQHLLYAITVLASSSGVATERAKFMELVREQVQQLQDTHAIEAPALTFTGSGLHAVRPEDTTQTLAHELHAPLRLEKHVSGILLRLEKELDEAEAAIGEKLHVLDLDNDGLITPGELQDALRFLRSNLDEEDLLALLERLNIKAEGGSNQPIIPVADLIKLTEQPSTAKLPSAVAKAEA